ncbi:hypothetical protein GOODEAATRI_024979 [Goodea atripinnis]|uniref:Uncharacterized protein n=1 Tax=Goodea atripinnis TaxID=208336 RepID=A0ABV0NXG2_9TELE
MLTGPQHIATTFPAVLPVTQLAAVAEGTFWSQYKPASLTTELPLQQDILGCEGVLGQSFNSVSVQHEFPELVESFQALHLADFIA